MGGALRQSGSIAAAGIYALEHHVERMAEDHANARLFAESIANLPGVGIDPATVETNIVFFDIGGTGLTAQEVGKRLDAHGVRIGPYGGTSLRAVHHLDVSRAGVGEAAPPLREAGVGAGGR